MVTRQPIPFVVFHINWQASGWSERYYLPMLSWERAAELGNRLARWRIAGCCSGAKLIWARLAFTDRPNFSEPLRSIGLTSDKYRGAGSGQPEDPFLRLHYRYETADGNWNTRLFGGIPDQVVTEMTLVRDFSPQRPENLTPDVDNVNERWADIFRYMLLFIRENTVYSRPVKDSDPPARSYKPWHAVVFRKVANRNTGRDFLRVSWESARVKPAGDPGVDPPWHAAPHFTPCGAAVGVVRSAYQRPCIWYRNGPLGRIRFYFVPESNPILWYRTVFWPYSQDLEIRNVGRPGEQTNSPRRWDRGDDFLGLDGTHPTGTAEDYAGDTDVPWTPAVPTPEAWLPRCNFEWIDADTSGGWELGGTLEIGPHLPAGLELGGELVPGGTLLTAGLELGGTLEVGPHLPAGLELGGEVFPSGTLLTAGLELGGTTDVGPHLPAGLELGGESFVAGELLGLVGWELGGTVHLPFEVFAGLEIDAELMGPVGELLGGTVGWDLGGVLEME